MKFLPSFDLEQIAYQHINDFNPALQTIIFVHGLGGDPNFNIPLINKILAKKNKYNIVLYNLRGHGHSSVNFPKSTEFIEDCLVKDLHLLIKHLKLNGPIMIGHSLGGIVIQEYIQRKLEPVPKKVVLICSPTDIFGFNFIRKISYKILSLLPKPKKQITEKPIKFHLQFSNGYDISIKRLWSDTQIVGGLLRWILITGSVLGWRNKNLNYLDSKDHHYIYSKKDAIVHAPIQKWKLRKLSSINKILINSNHICPITNTDGLATIISEII